MDEIIYSAVKNVLNDILNTATDVALYLTLALIVLSLVLGIFIYKFRKQSFGSYQKTACAFFIGYAISLAAMLLTLTLYINIYKGYLDYTTFIPIVVTVLSVIVLGIIYYCFIVFHPQKLSIVGKISILVICIELLAILITQTVKYYRDNPSPEVSGETQLYIYTALLIAIIVLLALFVGKKEQILNKSRAISYAAICIALSFALSYVRIFELPQGGSITLASLLPLMIYSYMFGIRRGVILGAVYGLLQFIQAPWFYHPIQFLLDYPIAFAAIGLSGLFRNIDYFKNKKPLQFALGAVIAVIIRYFSHVVSGIFVFGSGDPENYSAVAWSFLYNSFAFADMAICLVAGCTLFASRSFVKLLNKANI